jgi:hypothetical protein
MANETIKVLLMVFLLGGLRTAMFVTEIPRAQWIALYHDTFEWIVALFWPAATRTA